MSERRLDVVTLGRSSVDLYGEQVGSPLEDVQTFAVAARQPLCRGFAVGRSIFGAPAEAWMRGTLPDGELVGVVAANYRSLTERWIVAERDGAPCLDTV